MTRSIERSTAPLRIPVLVILYLGILSLVPSVAPGVPQADLGQPIDISLRKAALPSVLESFARIAGGELDIEAEIDGSTTIDLKSVPWKQALDQLCRIHSLSCYWWDSDPPESESSRLVVRRASGFAGMAESIDMELRKAPMQIVLQALDSVAGESFHVEVDPQLQGVVDVQLSSTPWPEALESICRPERCLLNWSRDSVFVEPSDGAVATEGAVAWKVMLNAPELEQRVMELLDTARADRLPFSELDALCKEMACDWTLRWDEPPVLLIKAGDQPAPAAEPRFGKNPIVLETSVSSGGARTSRTFAFGWDSPSHRLEPAASQAGPAVRLTWIAFSAGQQMLLPYTIRCDDSDRYDVQLPIALPLAGPWQDSFDEAHVEIRVAEATTPADPNVSHCADEPASFQVSLRADQQAVVAPGLPALPTKPGNYLMVTPRGEPNPSAALVYLGPNSDGTKALVLVAPGEEDGDEVSLRRLDLGPGETWSRPAGPDDSGAKVYVTVGPETKRP
ncbi:MAG: hypothetical protein MPN21_25070 [Thermoanaerobaculia bacterium]|nr:hypothetical protein [Thermoanaerobaculia bacterium]